MSESQEAKAAAVVPPLSPYVARTLEALRADGIQPTDAEIAWLVLLRTDCDKPCVDGIGPQLGASLTVLGETWWPLHERATSWMLRAGALCPELRTDCFLFAHIYSAPGDRRLDLWQGPEAIRAEVSAWRLALPLHEENTGELVRLLRVLDGDATAANVPREHTPATPYADLGGIGMLCRLFPGTTPEYWRSGISRAEIDGLLARQETGPWATAQRRSDAIGDYLRAVKLIRCNHG